MITEIAGSILSSNQALFQVRVKTTSANKMSGELFTRPSYSFETSGKPSDESTVSPALCLVRSPGHHPSVSKAQLIGPSTQPRIRVGKPLFYGRPLTVGVAG